MSYWPLKRTACAVVVLTCAVPVFAHDGDRKLLDRQPPYPGPGWTQGGGGPEGPEGPGFASSGISLYAWLSLNDLSGIAGLPIDTSDNGNSCWGYVSPAGREYAIMGLHRGTMFIEITTPGTPTFAGFIAGPVSLWRDVKTYQNYCYAISEGGNGIQVISMANIDGVSNRVSLVTEVTAPGSTPATHTLAVNTASGRLYRCGGGTNIGLRIYSLANPSAPTFLGSWTDKYVHECQVLSYTSGPYAGHEIAFCCSEFGPPYSQPGLDILDVTNPAAIVNLYPTRVTWAQGGFSHQMWVNPDRTFAYLNDEFDEQQQGFGARTIIIDVRFLIDGAFTVPSVAGYFFNGNTSIDHNMYVNGNLIFASNYRSGLRIFCAQNPTALSEIAYFDTYPTDDNPNYNGLWNNYSFFPSGTVIGSDIERGLFIWDVSGATKTLAFSYPQGRPSLIAPAGGTTMQVSIAPPPTACANGTVLPGSALLYVNSGSGWTTTALASLGGSLYQATFPAAPCEAIVSYYVSVQNDVGTVFNSPAGAPGTVYSAIAANGLQISITDEFETNSGWTVGDPQVPDTATLGTWERGDPEPTPAQPGDDHTPAPGTQCWVTGLAAGTGVGSFDVDGGKTTLMSPTINATTLANPRISYWRWYSNTQGNEPNADTFVVSISNNNGATWTTVETVGPAGPETSGGWFQHVFRIADVIPPTAQMKMRFVASDLAGGSVVEAAVDDFLMFEYQCPPVVCTKADVNNDGSVDGSDIDAFTEVMITGGTPGSVPFCATDINNNGQLEAVADVIGFVTCVLNAGCP